MKKLALVAVAVAMSVAMMFGCAPKAEVPAASEAPVVATEAPAEATKAPAASEVPAASEAPAATDAAASEAPTQTPAA
ncbi:MAG: hypothetical protein RR413_01385 [Christensenellaceae bacterium]